MSNILPERFLVARRPNFAHDTLALELKYCIDTLGAKMFIVITSIMPPSPSVLALAKRNGVRLIVIGDKKTPPDWYIPGVAFISASSQDRLNYGISKRLPWNHYSRKNLGYLRAFEQGATIIVDTDDDNMPKENWSFPSFSGNFNLSENDLGFLNIYTYFTDSHIWPRGFPLNRIRDEKARVNASRLSPATVRIGIWQALADGDPDVDAIYRLVDNRPCHFKQKPPVVLGRGTCCPFNSQNTAFSEAMFPLLFLPTQVNSRFTDILRGLVAQPIMWKHGYSVGFAGATVVHERNPHNYLDDFKAEIALYLNADRIIEIVENNLKEKKSIEDNLYEAYESLVIEGIVPAAEILVLERWLEDLANIKRQRQLNLLDHSSALAISAAS